MEQYIIDKVLNNNVIIANKNNKEVVLIGKGIGFNKKARQVVHAHEMSRVDKVFELKTVQEQERYKNLIAMTDDHVINTIVEVVAFINNAADNKVNDKIMLSLTDHIIFALKRYNEGIIVANPFLKETATLYQQEFLIAEQVVQMLNDKLNVNFPRSEIGFIALHIHSSVNNHSLQEMNLITEVLQKAIRIIEIDLKVNIDKESISYARFVRHLNFAIQRVMTDERMPEQNNLEKLLKEQYPLCYNTAVKIVKMMQSHLNKPVYEAELVYLTMHIQSFNTEVDNV